MKRITALLVGLLFSVQTVAATFAPHQILTATDLNNALANAAITSGTISGATISTSPISGSTGAFTTLASPSVSLTGGLIDGVSLGTITPAAGAFTTLSASSTVSGTGFSTYLASPPAIGGTVPAAGSFTTLSASGAVSGTGFSTYLASPPAIGGTAPAAGAFTTLSASGAVSGTGFSTYLASPPAIGGTTPAAGSFTNLSSSGTVSGTGFSAYLASPPAIGGTTPAAGSFTTVTSTVATGTPPLTVTSTTPVTNLSIGGNAATATTATTATNLAGGAGGSVPYQSAAGTTAMLANGASGQVLQSNGGTAAPSWSSPAVHRGYLSGLTLSTAGASATMSIATGEGTDSGNAVAIVLTSALSKTTSAWAVGTAQGGLDTGTIANNTWYYFYLIRRPDTGVVDVIFSLSSSAPTLPANYTQYRYIGAGLTNGSGQWTAFTQKGREFYWSTPIQDFNGAGAATAALLTLSVPRGRKVKGAFNLYVAGNSQGCYLSDPDNADVAPSNSGVSPFSTFGFGSSSFTGSVQAQCWTNTSAQIRHREVNTATVGVVTLGWLDLADSQ